MLSDPTLDQILDYCADDPVERVFLEDAARHGYRRFRAVEEGGRLASLCYFGANIVPSGRDCAVFAREAAARGTLMISGDERAVSELWEEARDSMSEPREDRPGQPVYALREPPRAEQTGLRAATLDDLDLLFPACVEAHREELGNDSLARDPEGFRRRTISQIEEGRSWLWAENDAILFKAEAAAWTPYAVQLQQVWVDPEARREGYATLGLRDLCCRLLQQVPTVCLFVRAENEPAIHLYEKIGMERAGTYRSVLF